MKPKSEAQKVAEFAKEFLGLPGDSLRERQIKFSMAEFRMIFQKRDRKGFTHELIEWKALEEWTRTRLTQMYDNGFYDALLYKQEP